MQSRRNGEFGRSFMSVLAALTAAVVPSLASSPALADDAPATTDSVAPDKAAPAKPRRAKKPHAAKKPEDAKPKTTASRAASKGKKLARRVSHEPAPRCLGTTIALDRSGLEGQSLMLLDCHKKPIEAAHTALSVLARPWGVQKPAHLPLHPGKPEAPPAHAKTAGQKLGVEAPALPPGEIAPGIHLLDPGLLARVDAIARHFPGKPVSLVSGYRPRSRGSLHQTAKALDLRVVGVSNEELSAFCKTLADTGCGYYPNSSFVHVDVRKRGGGGVSWIDASGPGETPHYVKQWPLTPEESDAAVLPPDAEPHDGAADLWARDPADEHARAPEPVGKPPEAASKPPEPAPKPPETAGQPSEPAPKLAAPSPVRP
jgi:hypothetical protein